MSIDVPNYRIIERLGTGQGGSTLYKAKAITAGTFYTIKHIKVQSPEANGLVDQMKNEHACGSALDHPVLRKTYELRYVRRRLSLKAAMLFMEYVDGETLSECNSRLSLSQIISILERTAEGLSAMHEGGFVHADLKPGNILVQPDLNVKLIDFGQSSPINEAKPRVQGTIDYIAPEQATRQALDARTDVFSLGASLHRILTGKPVVTEMNQKVDIHSMGRVGMRVSENLTRNLDEFPTVVTKLIQDCCQRDPAKRPKDMVEFIERCRMARMIISKRQGPEEVVTNGEPEAED